MDLGHEVQYTLAGKTPSSGKVSAENVKKMRKGTITPHTVEAEIYEGIVVRPLRNVNPDQAQYAGLVKLGSDSKLCSFFELKKAIYTLILDGRTTLKDELLKDLIISILQWMLMR